MFRQAMGSVAVVAVCGWACIGVAGARADGEPNGKDYIRFLPLGDPKITSQTPASERLNLWGTPPTCDAEDRDRDGISDTRQAGLMALCKLFSPVLVPNTTSLPLDHRVFLEADQTPLLHVDRWDTSRLDEPVDVSAIDFSRLGTPQDKPRDECISDAGGGSEVAAADHCAATSCARCQSAPTDTVESPDQRLRALLYEFDPTRKTGGTIDLANPFGVSVLYFDFPGHDAETWKAAYVTEAGASPALRAPYRDNLQIYAHPFLAELARKDPATSKRPADSEARYELVIQYWFFYPYNDFGNDHEGDWEHINVVVRRPGDHAHGFSKKELDDVLARAEANEQEEARAAAERELRAWAHSAVWFGEDLRFTYRGREYRAVGDPDTDEVFFRPTSPADPAEWTFPPAFVAQDGGQAAVETQSPAETERRTFLQATWAAVRGVGTLVQLDHAVSWLSWLPRRSIQAVTQSWSPTAARTWDSIAPADENYRSAQHALFLALGRARQSESLRLAWPSDLDGANAYTPALVIDRVEYYFHHFVMTMSYGKPDAYARDFGRGDANPERRNQSYLWRKAYDRARDIRYRTHPLVFVGGDSQGFDQLLVAPGRRNGDSHGSYPVRGIYRNIGPVGATEVIHADPHDGKRFDGRDRITLLPDWEHVLFQANVGGKSDVKPGSRAAAIRRNWAWLLLPVRWGQPATSSPGAGIVRHADTGNVAPLGPAYNPGWNRTGPSQGYDRYVPHLVNRLPGLPAVGIQDVFWKRLGFLNAGRAVFVLPPLNMAGTVAGLGASNVRGFSGWVRGRRDRTGVMPVLTPTADPPFRSLFASVRSGASTGEPDLAYRLQAVLTSEERARVRRFSTGTPAIEVAADPDQFYWASGFDLPIGRHVVMANSYSLVRNGLVLDALTDTDAPLHVAGKLTSHRYQGSLRYNALTGAFQPYVRTGYGVVADRVARKSRRGGSEAPTDYVWGGEFHAGVGFEAITQIHSRDFISNPWGDTGRTYLPMVIAGLAAHEAYRRRDDETTTRLWPAYAVSGLWLVSHLSGSSDGGYDPQPDLGIHVDLSQSWQPLTLIPELAPTTGNARVWLERTDIQVGLTFGF